jgi:outer membrane receptor for ferrienterochelin and colicins
LDYSAGAHVRWSAPANHALTFAATTDNYNAYTVANQTGNNTRDNTYGILTSRITDAWTHGESLRLMGGYEFNRESSYSPGRFGTNVDSATHTSYNNNLFLQGEIKLWQGLECVVAGRLTQHAEFGFRATPKLSLMYRWSNFRFRAGVSNGFKTPTLKEMYYSFNMGGVSYIQGNPELMPEMSWYKSVSAEYISAKANISVTAYHNQINNKISTVEYITPEFTIPVIRYENVSDAVIRGIDVAAQAYVFTCFSISANYAFVDAQDEATDLPFVGTSSKHSFSGSVLFRYPYLRIGGRYFPFSVNVSGYAASPRLYNSYEGGIVQRESKNTSVWRAVYTQKFPTLWNMLNAELQAGIDNIFNWTDPAISINPGRTYFVALKFNFRK